MKLKPIDSESILKIPLFLDRVAAGFPSPAADYMEERINLNSTLIKHPDSTYMLRVEGNSMIDANINDGDVCSGIVNLVTKSEVISSLHKQIGDIYGKTYKTTF